MIICARSDTALLCSKLLNRGWGSTQTSQCLFGVHKALVCSQYCSNTNPGEAEAGMVAVIDHPQLHGEFKASLKKLPEFDFAQRNYWKAAARINIMLLKCVEYW